MKALTLTVAAMVGGAAPIAARADQPPLIDRNLFFGEIAISGAQISPDGRFISFLKPYKGTRNIWVKGADEPFSAARPVSAEATRPIRSYFWSRDSKYILYSQDSGGDENFNIYAIDPTRAADPTTGVPPTRALTDLKGVRTEIFSVPRAKPDILYIGLNDRDPRWHDLYELHISTGEKTLLRKNTENISGWEFDHDGVLRLAERTNSAGDTEILRVDAGGFKQIYACTVLETCDIYGFDAANQQVYLITNKGPLDLIELELLNAATGAAAKVESDPEKRVDIITFGATSNDENLWIVSAYSDTEPGVTFVWNRKTQRLTLQYRVRDELPRAALAQRKPYHYRSSDGLDIPAYLTLPKGVPAKNLPLIVHPHGGPWARDSFGYDTYAQFLSNRGYAVLQPNFRGSTSFGKKFLNAGNGEWGRKMQDDLTWGVKALVAQGLADPARIGISGGSYGGYATLAGVAFTPTVYAAAVAIVAPSNLITLLDAIPPYWEAGRKQMYTRMADPTTPAGKALLMAESPLTQAKAIVTPLLVVQGKNDPRVNIRESDQIVAAVRDNGKPVEYLVAPDEGHGFARPINNLAMVAAMEGFLAQYLGGRYQQDVPADVAAKLKDITVDPRTVSGAVTLKGASAPAEN